jgi:ABC-type sugar transport system permease subunit
VALALHRALARTRIFRAIVALPLMVAPVVGALAWRFIFADGYGLIDAIAEHLGSGGRSDYYVGAFCHPDLLDLLHVVQTDA